MAQVDLVYIPPGEKAIQWQCTLVPNMTVEDVIHQSGLRESHPEIINMPVGIFATQVSLNAVVKAGDRIEIYRPLTLDPMEKRRQRAKNKK